MNWQKVQQATKLHARNLLSFSRQLPQPIRETAEGKTKNFNKQAINDIQWPFFSSFRNAFGFDDVDPLITIGRSHNAVRANESQLHREHVVPAVRIREKAYEMACGYASVEAIAEFLRRLLLSALLTEEEAELLDTRLLDGGIKLKTSMPLYWV